MSDPTRASITIEADVSASPEQVWTYWTQPEHIMKWNQASDDWHTPSAESDLRVGGKFTSRMESKDGKFGFDFWGIYDAVEPYHLLASTLGDERKVTVVFEAIDNGTKITETFEAESENSIELQREGWQAILDSFRNYIKNQ